MNTTLGTPAPPETTTPRPSGDGEAWIAIFISMPQGENESVMQGDVFRRAVQKSLSDAGIAARKSEAWGTFSHLTGSVDVNLANMQAAIAAHTKG